MTDEDEGSGQERSRKPGKRDSTGGGGHVATKRHKLARELSDLVNYCVSKRFEDFVVSQSREL